VEHTSITRDKVRIGVGMAIERLFLVIVMAMMLTIGLNVAILYRLGATTIGAADAGSQSAIQRQAPIDAPIEAVIDLRRLATQGAAAADIAIVEFADYECPYCRRYTAEVRPVVHAKYVKTGRIRYAVAFLPLPMHEKAPLLARAAYCALVQNRFWEMHETLFDRQPTLRDQLSDMAGRLGLKRAEFDKCIDNDGRAAERIAADMEDARRLGLNGTPSFAIGRLDDQGRLVVRKLLLGVQPVSAFDEAIAMVSK
jgi:protein-disulfide isomerase